MWAFINPVLEAPFFLKGTISWKWRDHAAAEEEKKYLQHLIKTNKKTIKKRFGKRKKSILRNETHTNRLHKGESQTSLLY
jgi:hypothetical protein